MSSLEIYKKAMMGKGLRDFFEIYEPSMIDLIEKLDKEEFLLKKFSDEEITQLQRLMGSSNMALKLSNDFGSLFNPVNKEETEEKLNNLKKAFNTQDVSRIGKHYHSILINTYIAYLERLKIYLLFFIDWNKLGKKRESIYGVRYAIDFLKQIYPNNKYLKYFESETRNSLTHYTFFWEHGNGGKIKLCSEIFDMNPKEMSLVNFMKEINELKVLSEGFFILIRDKLGLPEIISENMEK